MKEIRRAIEKLEKGDGGGYPVDAVLRVVHERRFTAREIEANPELARKTKGSHRDRRLTPIDWRKAPLGSVPGDRIRVLEDDEDRTKTVKGQTANQLTREAGVGHAKQVEE